MSRSSSEMRVDERQWSALWLVGAVLGLGQACSGDDARVVEASPDRSSAPGEQVSAMDERFGADEPVYAMLIVLFNPDGTNSSYVLPTHTFELDSASLDDAREFPGWVSVAAIGGALLVSSPDEPTITRYSLSDDLEWQTGDAISFASTGAPDAGFWDQFMLDEHTAYMNLEESQRVVWDPTTLTIREIRDDSALFQPGEDGLQLEAGFQRQPWFPSAQVLKPFYYRDTDWFASRPLRRS